MCVNPCVGIIRSLYMSCESGFPVETFEGTRIYPPHCRTRSWICFPSYWLLQVLVWTAKISHIWRMFHLIRRLNSACGQELRSITHPLLCWGGLGACPGFSCVVTTRTWPVGFKSEVIKETCFYLKLLRTTLKFRECRSALKSRMAKDKSFRKLCTFKLLLL